MRILIVRKPTNFELHGTRVLKNMDRGQITKHYYDRLINAHDEHYMAFEELTKKLSNAGIYFQSIMRDDPWPDTKVFELIITLGGDGTLLSVSHKLGSDQKILGIRSSVASVGYTCAYGAKDIETLCKQIVSQSIDFVAVERLQFKIQNIKNEDVLTVPVLNDALFTNCNPAATSVYSLKFGAQEEAQKSSGIWISTAIGSTAAILAAGGTSLSCDDKHFQYQVRELYRAPGSNFKLHAGLFLPEDMTVVIENRNEKAILALDGQHGEVNLEFGDRIEALRGPSLYLARPSFQKKPQT